jgi:hypothetical protein
LNQASGDVGGFALQEGDDRPDHFHIDLFGLYHAEGFLGEGALVAVQLSEDIP